MVGVSCEGDLVILSLPGRRRDVLLSCAWADRLVRALREKAGLADLAAPSLARGEAWGCKVVSYDGFVAVRFYPPGVGGVGRVPLTAGAARAVADEVEFKLGQAKYKMRFEFGRSGGRN